MMQRMVARPAAKCIYKIDFPPELFMDWSKKKIKIVHILFALVSFNQLENCFFFVHRFGRSIK